jgi:hypothetical protein
MKHNPIQIPAPDVLCAVPAPIIAAAIDQLIEALDERDGDPDLEPNGDEEDFSVVAWSRNDPGYRLAEYRDADLALAGLEDDEDDDPGGGNVTDDPHDEYAEGGAELAAWPERINQTKFPDRLDGWNGSSVHEDEEDDDQDACLAADDDPARRLRDGLPGDSFDTEPNGDEGDHSGEPWA